MRRARYVGGSFGALLMMAVSSSQAAVVTANFDITATDFVRGPGVQPPTVPPYPTVHLNFTAVFDDATSFGPTTNGLTIDSNTLPYAAEFQYSAKYDVLTIATKIVNAYTYSDTPDTFGIFIDNALTPAPLIFGVDYTNADGITFQAFQPSIAVSSTISTVPLPSSAPMFGAALLALGTVGYGVKRKKAAAEA